MGEHWVSDSENQLGVEELIWELKQEYVMGFVE